MTVSGGTSWSAEGRPSGGREHDDPPHHPNWASNPASWAGGPPASHAHERHHGVPGVPAPPGAEWSSGRPDQPDPHDDEFLLSWSTGDRLPVPELPVPELPPGGRIGTDPQGAPTVAGMTGPSTVGPSTTGPTTAPTAAYPSMANPTGQPPLPPAITPEEAGIFRARTFEPRTYDARSDSPTRFDEQQQVTTWSATHAPSPPTVPVPIPLAPANSPSEGWSVPGWPPAHQSPQPGSDLVLYQSRDVEPYFPATGQFAPPPLGPPAFSPMSAPPGAMGTPQSTVGPRHALPAGVTRAHSPAEVMLPPDALPHPPRAVVRRRLRRRRALEWPILIAFSLIAAVVVRSFVFQTFFIPSPSMHDTLLEGDRVLVNKLSYRLHEVNRGDVVVFSRPENLHIQDEDLIKRVIGLPGETVEAHDQRVYIDGRGLNEPYTQPDCEGTQDFPPVTVPSDHVFVMGDNRCNSTDSRVFGPVSQDLLVGRAFARIWPGGRIGWL